MGLREIGYEDGDFIHLAMDNGKLRVLLNTGKTSDSVKGN
jgi:hypothetical protein